MGWGSPSGELEPDPAARRSLLLATRNPHKLEEVERLLAPLCVWVEPIPDDVVLPPEDGSTFADNALPKARAAAAATERRAIADDSGIEAAVLGGAPGVRSARYAAPNATDEDNLVKLIQEVPPGSGLRYVCALAYVDPISDEERIFFGECRGAMADRRRGARGFGYDPVFVPEEPGDGRTMAELSDREKDLVSHRGRAVRALAAWLLRE